MTIDIRQAIHPADMVGYDTEVLRENFLIEEVFVPGEIALTYWHTDRLVIGGATPTSAPLKLETDKAIGQKTFLARRELGICNVGGPGKVTCDGKTFQVNLRDMLYVGMGTVDVTFASDDAANPAKFYLLSTPAHATHPTVLVREADANALELGTQEQANTRTLRQYIIPGRVDSCQLVMGLTTLKPGNIWNTMPAHVHDRRCEAYLYFGLPDDARVFHMMGEPQETRHLVVANEQAILSPGWSIHSGVGTKAYSFIWAMGGDNQDFTDMDMVAMGDLR
ncbi:5-dehydro-4-deoxy-D-glucuronate isomerase [Phreatobacter aquaticus]|uniref:4-deoxy-L-threo-5-hexosulose-uronate ketol-isomerase n=1 Tax=Phreatobacter aquaticus TaxID=2570229 RepID=A0A4D7QGN5_9HYPH|nr:5-dehydro-4-deoxy-D-glucuronate isomerase [Phreatobacter aquaticus]QCK84614.1 5-dehydro-4-deoxy-D-glucuronate isomerase [Phreatobacter aquaticus]